jgi:hypothetical protein
MKFLAAQLIIISAIIIVGAGVVGNHSPEVRGNSGGIANASTCSFLL